MNDKIGVYFYIEKKHEESRLNYVIKNIETGKVFIKLKKKLKNEGSIKNSIEGLEFLLSNILSLIKLEEIKEDSKVYFFTNNTESINIICEKLYLNLKSLKFFLEKINLCECKEFKKVTGFIKKEPKPPIALYIKCKKISKEYRKILRRSSTIELLKEKYKEAKTLVFFDFEMNCLVDFKSVEIISVGACKLDIESGKVHRFYNLIKPIEVNELTTRCIEITALKQEEIDNADSFDQVFNNLGNWINEEKALCLYWGGNDIAVLKNDYRRHLKQNKTALAILKNNIDFQEVLCKDLLNKEDMLSLTNALLEYNIEFEGIKHNSGDDAFNLYRLFDNVKFNDN